MDEVPRLRRVVTFDSRTFAEPSAPNDRVELLLLRSQNHVSELSIGAKRRA
jgi:hypothetical protein